MKKTILFIFILLCTVCGTSPIVFASSYNQGKYNAVVPYNTATYIAIATSGNISLAVTPVSGGSLVTGSNNVTVTSTDVVGYKLYLRSGTSTNMNNLGDIIPTSANGTPAALAVNTWGYNTDGSSNFVGSSLTDTLIRTLIGPASTGDVTTVTYGINVDLAKPAGNYTTSIIYTAVPEID